jgi:hypothetical protein
MKPLNHHRIRPDLLSTEFLPLAAEFSASRQAANAGRMLLDRPRMMLVKEDARMTAVSPTPEQVTPPAPFLKQGQREADFVEADAPHAACLPALARHFRITELQHWIDLSA